MKPGKSQDPKQTILICGKAHHYAPPIKAQYEFIRDLKNNGVQVKIFHEIARPELLQYQSFQEESRLAKDLIALHKCWNDPDFATESGVNITGNNLNITKDYKGLFKSEKFKNAISSPLPFAKFELLFIIATKDNIDNIDFAIENRELYQILKLFFNKDSSGKKNSISNLTFLESVEKAKEIGDSMPKFVGNEIQDWQNHRNYLNSIEPERIEGMKNNFINDEDGDNQVKIVIEMGYRHVGNFKSALITEGVEEGDIYALEFSTNPEHKFDSERSTGIVNLYQKDIDEAKKSGKPLKKADEEITLECDDDKYNMNLFENRGLLRLRQIQEEILEKHVPVIDLKISGQLHYETISEINARNGKVTQQNNETTISIRADKLDQDLQEKLGISKVRIKSAPFKTELLKQEGFGFVQDHNDKDKSVIVFYENSRKATLQMINGSETKEKFHGRKELFEPFIKLLSKNKSDETIKPIRQEKPHMKDIFPKDEKQKSPKNNFEALMQQSQVQATK